MRMKSSFVLRAMVLMCVCVLSFALGGVTLSAQVSPVDKIRAGSKKSAARGKAAKVRPVSKHVPVKKSTATPVPVALPPAPDSAKVKSTIKFTIPTVVSESAEDIEALREALDTLESQLVDEPAAFPGGNAALVKFISTNVVYPSIAQEQGLQGVVIVRFCVGTDGSVSKAKIRKSLSRECDNAALDVVRKLPRFTPAKQNGKPVCVWYVLPVRFTIS